MALALATEQTREAREWDAHAGYEIGTLIRRYLRLHPAPRDSPLARDLAASGQLLEESGRRELDRLGQRHLRAVGASHDSDVEREGED